MVAGYHSSEQPNREYQTNIHDLVDLNVIKKENALFGCRRKQKTKFNFEKFDSHETKKKKRNRNEMIFIIR